MDVLDSRRMVVVGTVGVTKTGWGSVVERDPTGVIGNDHDERRRLGMKYNMYYKNIEVS